MKKFILWPARLAAGMTLSARDLALAPLGWPRDKASKLALILAAIAFVFWFMGWKPAAILQVLTLSLVILVPLMMMGTKPSKWAFIGGVVYTASYFISNSWQVAGWVLDPMSADVAEAIKQATEGAPISSYGFALRLDQANKRLLVAVYCFTTFFALSKHDLQARLIWLVTALAETFSFLANVECKLWHDPLGSDNLHLATEWGVTVSQYACGRVYPSWAPYLAPIITSLYLIYVNHKYGKPRAK